MGFYILKFYRQGQHIRLNLSFSLFYNNHLWQDQVFRLLIYNLLIKLYSLFEIAIKKATGVLIENKLYFQDLILKKFELSKKHLVGHLFRWVFQIPYYMGTLLKQPKFWINIILRKNYIAILNLKVFVISLFCPHLFKLFPLFH